jgi:uncharacterized protein YuzE
MRIRCDEEADALYVRFVDAPIIESKEVRPGVNLDLGTANEIVGIEVLGISHRVPTDALRQVRLERL